jgi:hypothetical protein
MGPWNFIYFYQSCKNFYILPNIIYYVFLIFENMISKGLSFSLHFFNYQKVTHFFYLFHQTGLTYGVNYLPEYRMPLSIWTAKLALQLCEKLMVLFGPVDILDRLVCDLKINV